MSDLSKYKYLLENMSVKITDGQKKPNKAIMLLSVIDLIRCGYITDNRIYIENTIQEAFEYNWRKYVNPNPPTCWTPFWHLKKESFWHFVPIVKNFDIESIVPSGQTASFWQIRLHIKYAYIDQELYELLVDKSFRTEITRLLYRTYLILDK